MLFFTYDLDNYKNNLRDFYFDMVKEVPGPICMNTKDLIDFINNNLDEYNQIYGEKYKKFNEKFNEFDNGQASRKVIDLMRK